MHQISDDKLPPILSKHSIPNDTPDYLQKVKEVKDQLHSHEFFTRRYDMLHKQNLRIF